MLVQQAGTGAINRNLARDGVIAFASQWALVGIALFVIATTIYGTWRFFSPVPFWDQWDGYIGFYSKIREGLTSYWWSQQNEHRIVFSRLLFLADIELFGGLNAFTVVCNLALLGLLAWCIWRESKSLWAAGLLGSLLFSWAQQENITWGFESQCIAVYLFAFLAFAQVSRTDRSALRILAALGFCAAATLTMGNGFVAFLIAALQSASQRRLREAGIYLAGGAVAVILYFHNYIKPVLPVDPSVSNMPLAPVEYFLRFMGNPFAYVPGFPVEWCAPIGAFITASGALLVGYVILRLTMTPYRSFLIAGIAMAFVSIFGASHGRWVMGLDSATGSRYTTPTLIGYALLLLLALDIAEANVRKCVMLVGTVLAAVLAFAQLGVNDSNAFLFDRKLAVLGQKIGIDHLDLDGVVFPTSMHDRYLKLADAADAYQIGLWGKGWLHDAGVVQFDPSRVDQSLCRGAFDTVTKDSVAWSVAGWVQPLRYANGDVLVLLVRDGQTVGYAVSGQSRPDVEAVIPGAAGDTGWDGFSKVGDGLEAYAYIGNRFCRIPGH